MSPATPSTKVTSSTTRNKLLPLRLFSHGRRGFAMFLFPFSRNFFRMPVLCLTFPKAFMMTSNVVGRRLTMNWSYGSVSSARAAAKKAPSSARRWNAACSGRKRPPSARYTARTAAGSLQFCFLRRSLFAEQKSESAHAQVLLGVSAFAAKNGGKVRDGLWPLSL